MRMLTVSSADVFSSSDNPTLRLDVPYHMLIQTLKRDPKAIGKDTLDLLQEVLGVRKARTTMVRVVASESIDEAAYVLMRALGIRQPSDQLRVGMRELARQALLAERERLDADRRELVQRIGLIDRALDTA